jgi:hypothetical protein
MRAVISQTQLIGLRRTQRGQQGELHVLIHAVAVGVAILEELIDVGRVAVSGIENRVAEQPAVLLRLVKIDPPIALIDILRVRIQIMQVVSQPGQISRAKNMIRIHERGGMVKTACRNDVPRKRRSGDDVSTAIELAGKRIVKLSVRAVRSGRRR